ncbi:flagellar hook-associated protein 2 [Gracilibacillus halotolerans]|uniref:Flagellar hook-associated protein 2 n=1 Tax=Gracilibacillus halotolerans TaxID=74386 RepID=A0A841RI17_9BACI|nr:flagellar filament capping protein FliD [Gracilibacillus halotolerans]MBB6512301.1 flagellar hook-associated protein 2 [Gracilibacillus halotolerans]
MRIAGFASGMDIDTMVKDLMNVERIPLQKLESKKQTLEWTQEAYRGVNTLLLDFENTLFNMRLGSTFRSREVSSSNDEFVSATASSAANLTSFQISKVSQLAEAAYRVNASGISVDDSNKIDKNKALFQESSKLAQAPGDEMVWNQGAIKKESFVLDSDTNQVEFNKAVSGGYENKLHVQVNGKTFNIAETGDNLAANEVFIDVDGNLNFKEGVLKKGARVTVDYVADKFEVTRNLGSGTKSLQLSAGSIAIEDFSLKLTVGEEEKNYQIVPASGEGTVYQLSDGLGTIDVATGRINFTEELAEDTEVSLEYKQNFTSFKMGAHTSDGKVERNFFISGDKSLNAMVAEVNSANLGISMMYDEFSDKISINRTETGNFNDDGDENEIIIDGAFLNHSLGFSNSTEVDGKNAKFTINGLETERPSNSFQIDGVTFQLKQTFTTANEEAVDGEPPLQEVPPVRLSVSNNTDDVFEKIKDFVETYNTLIDSLNSKVNETYYRDYGPLTDEQREQLSDKQQEDWEEKAKSGMLRRDSILQDALSGMRRDFYSPVNNEASGVFNQLATIGITTTKDYMAGGKLEINETKLREAIEEDPAAVENLFRGDGNSYGEKGIVRRLEDTISGVKDRIYERAGRTSWNATQYTIGRNMNDLDKQIERFESRLKQIEDRYWRQFTAMEKAMAQANQQASYLMQQFGGGMQ